MKPEHLEKHIFSIQSDSDFQSCALDVFRYQAAHNPVYREYLSHLRIRPDSVTGIREIPFLPVELFKTRNIMIEGLPAEISFSSSGTTGMIQSKHPVHKVSLYTQSFLQGFLHFYGKPEDYCILALLPSYQEREGSSLIYMVDELIRQSNHPQSGYFLYDLQALQNTMQALAAGGQKVLLIGVTYALLDFAEQFPFPINNTILMETGGMKGRRKEILREELHEILGQAFQLREIHSEYGMTELLSQAYSKGDGLFETPPWMQVLIREVNDPFSYTAKGQTGGINIIDLASLYSCSFIATQDLGRFEEEERFRVLGRFDHSDIRGCNLLVQ